MLVERATTALVEPAGIANEDVATTVAAAPPLVCLSHLRWDFVRQRPQHLMSRFAQRAPVWFWEEHIACDHPLPFLEHHYFPADKLTVLRPRVPQRAIGEPLRVMLRDLYRQFVKTALRADPVLWYYTPMMLGFTADEPAAAVVYDCMDELSAFAHADPALLANEAALLKRADVVFTGGRSLYEAKRSRHNNVHAFPSSVDTAHFGTARTLPVAQRRAPVLGYFGVIDERLDLSLIAALAASRPDWRIEMVGPVVKIDPASVPKAANIVWLGSRDYAALPQLLAGWDVALMPFAINEATRFISPTKTPEYLAGGRPVVSTPIADVVAQYGATKGVWIAKDAPGFVAACEAALALAGSGPGWTGQADAQLAETSWDRTHGRMAQLIKEAIVARRTPPVRDLPRSKPRASRHDVVVVGAGFAGSVMAERFAADGGKRVLVIDRRDHVAGNAFDEADAAGVMIHRYGPHIFHTNSATVFDYLSRFTAWRDYQHRVLAKVGDQLVPMPINRTTLEMLYGVTLSDDAAAAAFLAARAEPRDPIVTSEDVVLNAVGRDLYETFFRGYTRKQWGLDPSQLDKSVTSRVPTRTDRDDRYFQDSFQAMPRAGYTAMFKRMLDHPNIEVLTGVEYRDIQRDVSAPETVFTGPIDEYFDYRFGKLPYRSLRFVHETHDVEQYQPAAVVNYPAPDVPFTRITEYKALTGQVHPRTSISYEYPCDEGDPYYPIPRPENQALFAKYQALADATPGVHFVGRLANYRYYNMDQVVGQALATYARLRERAAA